MQIRQDVAKHKMQEIYTQRFGKDRYEEIKRIKIWLAEHQQKKAMLLYLTDDDPYKFQSIA